MITSPAFAGKKYAVYGLARSGMATVDALLASGAEVMAWDQNEAARVQVVAVQVAQVLTVRVDKVVVTVQAAREEDNINIKNSHIREDIKA